ncbi:Hypothetical protein GLP15_4285 [Giardia lamblia P15]|uniref:Uncharacterized protein n=1 Tax=Giardia intestinalis (strain P15) TaxID=658858 RepID=E1EVN3_GIAIA|nr:Hypothetical protein GLP15_4285 [Giardia lamblia P15]
MLAAWRHAETAAARRPGLPAPSIQPPPLNGQQAHDCPDEGATGRFRGGGSPAAPDRTSEGARRRERGSPASPSEPPALGSGCVAPEPQQHPGPRGQSMSTGTGSRKPGNTYGTAFRPGPLLSSTARACGNTSAPAWPFDPQRGLEQRSRGTPPASGSPHCGPCTPARPQRTALLPLLRPRDRQGQSDHATPGPDAECRRPPGPSSGPLAAPGERGIRPGAFQTTGGLRYSPCHMISQPRATNFGEQQHQEALRRPTPGGTETARPETPPDWTSQRPQPQGLLGTATEPADLYGEGRGSDASSAL